MNPSAIVMLSKAVYHGYLVSFSCSKLGGRSAVSADTINSVVHK